MTVGLLGGTFDPIHCGHLDVARVALEALALDEVWIMPARVPPHRRHTAASAAHRFAMAALAVEDESRMVLSDLEMEKTGPSYTVETLDLLDARGDTARHSFVFVIGADAFRDIRSWRAYPEILDRCHFAVVSRPGFPASAIRSDLADLSPRMLGAPYGTPLAPSIFVVDTPTAPVSSTDVRRALGQRLAVTGMVPARVEAYIAKHRLYEMPTEAPQG
jgi:nicotinate-nucleotide adenylyltransferase